MRAHARREEHQINSIQARVISAGLRVLEAHGLECFNLRLIADEADIGIASIYHYFPSKDALLIKLALIGVTELRQLMEWRCEQATQPMPIRCASSAFFDFLKGRPSLFSLMFDSRLQVQSSEMREAELSLVRTFQVAVATDPRIPPERSEEVAIAIWALGRGMAAMIASQPDRCVPAEQACRLRAGVQFLIDRAPTAEAAELPDWARP